MLELKIKKTVVYGKSNLNVIKTTTTKVNTFSSLLSVLGEGLLWVWWCHQRSVPFLLIQPCWPMQGSWRSPPTIDIQEQLEKEAAGWSLFACPWPGGGVKGGQVSSHTEEVDSWRKEGQHIVCCLLSVWSRSDRMWQEVLFPFCASQLRIFGHIFDNDLKTVQR